MFLLLFCNNFSQFICSHKFCGAVIHQMMSRSGTKRLKYDQTMDTNNSARDYLKLHNNEFHSIVNGKHLSYEREVTIQTSTSTEETYKLYVADVTALKSEGFKWSCSSTYKDEDLLSTETNSKILKNIATEITKSSQIFSELESLSRKIPSQEVLKYDIPIIVDYFNHYATFKMQENESHIKFREHEILVFTKNSSLGSLGVAMSGILRARVSVCILATEEVAVVAQLFGKICLDAGVPSDALSVYLVEEKHLQKFIDSGTTALKQECTPVYNSKRGCTVVVTESGDMDSAVDMLVSDATCTHIYPWRTDRLLVQESIYRQFRKRFECKLSAASSDELDRAKKSAPKGTQIWQYPKKYIDSPAQFVVSENINLGDKLTDATTMQAYRTTKELLSLLDGRTPFAVSLWCDSVSVTNEISLAANVPVVWTNLYGLFDPSVQLKFRERGDVAVIGGEIGGNRQLYPAKEPTQLPNDTNTMNQLTAHLDSVKKCLPAWRARPYNQRVSLFFDALADVWKSSTDSNRTFIVKEMQKSLNHRRSDVKAIGNNLRVHMEEPIGLILTLGVPNNVTLIYTLISVIEGNGIVYSLENDKEIFYKLITCLKGRGLPVSAFVNSAKDIVRSEAAKIHEIKSIYEFGYNSAFSLYIYNTKAIWSPIGETFAN